MKKTTLRSSGFTLVEILVVIAILALLMAIILPVAGGAKKAALKRRAMLEMNSIKVAVLQYYAENNIMPWGTKLQDGVGADVWAQNDTEQANLIKILTGDNAKKKAYLQVPSKSRLDPNNPDIFTDPWKQYYRIGIDRDRDGSISLGTTPDSLFGGYRAVRERVVVYSLGPLIEGEQPTREKAMTSFDLIADGN